MTTAMSFPAGRHFFVENGVLMLTVARAILKDRSEGILEHCAARKRHVEAYAALQSKYRMLMGLLAQDVRLSSAEAAANLKIMMKACIDHKSGITTGGHNIMVDVIENEIAGKCLALGANLLREEIRELRPSPR